MADDLVNLVATIYLWEHQAKSGACNVCMNLDGWFTAEEEDEPPYLMEDLHDFCRCTWKMHTVTGLWRDKIEEIMNEHAEIKKGYDDAVAGIAFREYDIAAFNITLGQQKEDKAVQDANAIIYTERAEEAIATAQEIIDENDELTPEQQEQVDELLAYAEECLGHAEECVARSDELADMISETEGNIQEQQDLLEIQQFLKEDYAAKLLELEPILSYGCIEDKAAEIAGSRLILEF